MKRELTVSDKIWCKGIVAEIAEIVFQDDYGKDGLEVEFIDTEGKCRLWKQRFDGGYVLAKINDVPENVMKSVCKYFEEKLPAYVPAAVARASKHPEDELYTVVAKHRGSGKFATWTCWNESTQSLNHGHYDLNAHDAAEIARNRYEGR